MKTKFTVIVREPGQCRLGTTLNDDAALTLFAIVSEDPGSWNDIAACWPRYRSPQVPEFADGLPLRIVDFAASRLAIENTDDWLMVDLENKRIIAGSGLMQVGRDAVLTMGDESVEEQREWLVSIHLAPWWELYEGASAIVVDQDRRAPLVVPQADREFLFGKPLHTDLAHRMIAVFGSDAWQSAEADSNLQARYPFTVTVHREWLMTPRDDLGGGIPRQMLHGAHDWLERVIDGQYLRIQPDQEIQSIPVSIAEFDRAPMGSDEMIIYFDLCRTLIDRGWEWLAEQTALNKNRNPSAATVLQEDLVEVLASWQQAWLNQADEEGEIPQRIIEHNRCRVPRVLGYQVSGMADAQTAVHIPDCNCPICELLADQQMGPVFVGIDGHHLELDNEFAFSIEETLDEWELNQGSYGDEEFRDECNSDCEPDCGGTHASVHHRDQVQNFNTLDSRSVQDSVDECGPIWSGNLIEGPIPGDSSGNLQLAFLLTEVVGVLEQLDAPKSEIKQLNACFREFRRSDPEKISYYGGQLGQQLESIANQHPKLVPRVADFQSRIAEQIRIKSG